MRMAWSASSRYSIILLVLLLIFCFRVIAQLLQAFYPINILPPFEAWHSGAVPYPVLFVFQVVIIVIFGRGVWQLRNENVKTSYRRGKVILVFGGLYFASMLFRLLIGLTLAVDHSWFGAIIPTIFHLVLASFILIYGHYHYKFAAKING
jgi:hypothetical protein